MLQLDVVNANCTLKDPAKLETQFQQLKTGGVTGVMLDVWWGIVEQSPQQYNFSAYVQVVKMLQSVGLEFQAVMSFHQCGGNVGDACDIPLPSWVLDAAPANEIFYTDQWGHSDSEYISLGADNLPLIHGRTPIDCYTQYMQAFYNTFETYLGNVITLIEVGLGPSGEMRYPAYQSSQWSFCGIGAFQCWDSNMLAAFQKSAANAGHPEWNAPPTDAGSYNSHPEQTNFFTAGYSNAYGQFFLEWYSNALIEHGNSILAAAKSVFGNRVDVAAKVAGIHWWYLSDSHAAEVTAGYYNTNNNDGYAAIAKMFAQHNVWFLFTCMEMLDSEQPASCDCGPQQLVAQTRTDAWAAGLHYGGENALARYDQTAYQTIEAASDVGGRLISAFTYLRLDSTLLTGSNWQVFSSFVSNMNNL
eukprot:TRINITY_DN3220_c0_g1_i2.p1 TRINITY_DN3220_c0_g1~~TRINITY_DN3220_c0_g1_i2.p1  ORF type:complete len:415 (-),score=75.70 TRINITY_DN3220_c0_g1_i2:1163-2407(-)